MPSALASRFANALADAVLGGGGVPPQQTLSELRAFERLFSSSPELKNVLLSPAVTNLKKRAVIERLARAIPLSPMVRNFLYVVVDRRRANLLQEIGEAFELALDQRMGVVRARVTSAAPMDEQQQAALTAQLSRVAGKQVRSEFSVDPSLIGGVVARIGSTVYDGSVRTQLESLRGRLAAR